MITDPNILLSVINTKLRDFYSSLEDLCDDLDYDMDMVNSILGSIGYCYDVTNNQFIKNDCK